VDLTILIIAMLFLVGIDWLAGVRSFDSRDGFTDPAWESYAARP
jgi:hypothetical protein